MLQRRLTRQQVVSDVDPLLECAGRQMEDELYTERENTTYLASPPLPCPIERYDEANEEYFYTTIGYYSL